MLLSINISSRINPLGLLDQLRLNQGHDVMTSLAELVGNCCNPKIKATLIELGVLTGKYCYVQDNGIGMDEEGVQDMMNLYSENNTDYESVGMCGIGAKAAFQVLGKGTSCIILKTIKKDATSIIQATFYIDKLNDEEYRKEIEKHYKNTGEIKWFDSTIINNAEEVVKFREELGNDSGTQITVYGNSQLEDIIKHNSQNCIPDPEDENIPSDFKDSKNQIDPLKYLSVQFGKFSRKIDINYRIDNDEIMWYPHDPFDETSVHTWYKFQEKEKPFSCRIDVYKDTETNIPQFVANINEDGIHKKKILEQVSNKKPGGTWSKSTLKDQHNIPPSWEKQKIIMEYQVGVAKDPKLFDEENPELPGNTTISPSDIDKDVFKSKNKDHPFFNSHAILSRNDQRISCIRSDIGPSVSSSRGNAQSSFASHSVTSELSYRTLSKIGNYADIIFDINSNKSKSGSSKIPTNLSRLVYLLRSKYTSELWNWMAYSEADFKKNQVEETEEPVKEVEEPVVEEEEEEPVVEEEEPVVEEEEPVKEVEEPVVEEEPVKEVEEPVVEEEEPVKEVEEPVVEEEEEEPVVEEEEPVVEEEEPVKEVEEPVVEEEPVKEVKKDKQPDKTPNEVLVKLNDTFDEKDDESKEKSLKEMLIGIVNHPEAIKKLERELGIANKIKNIYKEFNI